MTYHRTIVVALVLACFSTEAQAQMEPAPATSEAVTASSVPDAPPEAPTDTPPPGAPATSEAPPEVEVPAAGTEEATPEEGGEPPPEEPPPEPEFQGFSDTELQALFMFGPQRLVDDGSIGAPILTFQHFSTFRWGSNFFFLDVEGQRANPNWHFWDEKFGLYFEYAPELSLTKIGLFTLPQTSFCAM